MKFILYIYGLFYYPQKSVIISGRLCSPTVHSEQKVNDIIGEERHVQRQREQKRLRHRMKVF